MPTAFQQACYDLLRQIPSGRVTTYAEIAHALGGKAYRAVGTAMNKNPHPVIVPCHRVVVRMDDLATMPLAVNASSSCWKVKECVLLMVG